MGSCPLVSLGVGGQGNCAFPVGAGPNGSHDQLGESGVGFVGGSLDIDWRRESRPAVARDGTGTQAGLRDVICLGTMRSIARETVAPGERRDVRARDGAGSKVPQSRLTRISRNIMDIGGLPEVQSGGSTGIEYESVGHSDRCGRRIEVLMHKDPELRERVQQAVERGCGLWPSTLRRRTKRKTRNTCESLSNGVLQLKKVRAPGALRAVLRTALERGKETRGETMGIPSAQEQGVGGAGQTHVGPTDVGMRGRTQRRSIHGTWREEDRCVAERRHDRHTHDRCV